MGGSAHLIIPVYQRNYDWKIEQCRQLYDDLVSVARKGLNSHFFGSVVSVSDPGGQMMDYLIIDGQQRLTTVSLLMLAIHRLLEEGTVQAEQKNLASLLLKKYLIDEFENDSQKIKLKPIKDDQRAFISLFDTDAEQIVESNLTINYRYFRDRIQRQEISIDALYSAISKLQIINITLNHEDDPQLIFESLNSTGLALSEGDKIRNYILMGLSLHEQEVYYTKYWNEIEKNTGYDVSSFVTVNAPIQFCRTGGDNIRLSQPAIPFGVSEHILQNILCSLTGVRTVPDRRRISRSTVPEKHLSDAR